MSRFWIPDSADTQHKVCVFGICVWWLYCLLVPGGSTSTKHACTTHKDMQTGANSKPPTWAYAARKQIDMHDRVATPRRPTRCSTTTRRLVGHINRQLGHIHTNFTGTCMHDTRRDTYNKLSRTQPPPFAHCACRCQLRTSICMGVRRNRRCRMHRLPLASFSVLGWWTRSAPLHVHRIGMFETAGKDRHKRVCWCVQLCVQAHTHPASASMLHQPVMQQTQGDTLTAHPHGSARPVP